jgi:hypothetical protein
VAENGSFGEAAYAWLEENASFRAPEAHLALHRHRFPGLRAYPLVCVLQAPAAGGPDRIMCPVGLAAPPGPTTPVVVFEGQPHFIMLRLMVGLPLRVLGDAVGTAEPARADITRGIDLLIFGI